MSKTMFAAYYDSFGEARDVLKVGEVPLPEPGPGEVRVKLKTSGVNPSDFKVRRGAARGGVFPRTIPHHDGAGVIDAVGDKSLEHRTGERVWTWSAQYRRPFGTGAQYVTLPSRQAVFLPDNVSFEEGACLGIPALTAWRAAYYDGRPQNETVLVQGGAGAVSHYAIQCLKAAGATVLTTASSPEKLDLARESGADAGINYRGEDVAQRVTELTGGQGVDRVIEVNLAQNATGYVNYVRPDGVVVVYGSDDWSVLPPLTDYLAHGLQLKFFIMYNLPDDLRSHAIAEISALLRDGALTHRVGARFPLSDIVAAHEAVEQRAVSGNVVLTIPD